MWTHDLKHWRWNYRDESGRVVYWISDLAVGSEFDNRDGFVSVAGERILRLPDEAYTLAHQHE